MLFWTIVICLFVASAVVGMQATLQPRMLGGESSPLTDTYVSTYEIVHEFPHDGNAFTQGLAFDPSGALYESDGLFGQSAVRKIDTMSGVSSTKTHNHRDHFGEGIEIVGDKLVQLTWKNRQINEFSLADLKHIRSVPNNIGREGWGLARSPDGQHLYLSDSTEYLYVLNSSTYEQIHKMQINDPRLRATPPFPIYGVNELEMVEDELWGNVYPMYQHSHSECLVRINPSTGAVIGWVDLRGLFSRQRPYVVQQPGNFVLNGIAYHKPSSRLYVTGKQWDKMYQIRVKPDPTRDASHIAQYCGLGEVEKLGYRKKGMRRLRG